MTNENLEKANKIKGEINTLEAEIDVLGYIKHSELRKLFNIPPKKTYKHLYCTENIDSIWSVVLLRQDEIKVLAEYKEEKVINLKKELDNL